MKKIISLLAALMIFTFSFLGEDVHPTSSSCADSVVMQSSTHVTKCGAVGVISAKFQKDAPTDLGASMHDCHFGHCAFTIRFPAKIDSPLPLAGTDVVRSRSLIHSGYRSETLRPPSRA